MWVTFKNNEWRLYFNEFCCSDTRVITLRKKEVPESIRLKFFENGEHPIEVSLIDLTLVKEDEKEMEMLKKENAYLRKELNEVTTHRDKEYVPFKGQRVDRDSGMWTDEYDEYLQTHDSEG